jgi:hypothetical protein
MSRVVVSLVGLAVCLAACSAFSRANFPCADGACPEGLVCVVDRCIEGEGEGEGEGEPVGEGEGELADIIPFGDTAPDVILEVPDGLLVAWTQLPGEVSALLESPGVDAQRIGLARVAFNGSAEVLADSGALSGIFIPDAAATSSGFLLGLQTSAAFEWAGCRSPTTPTSITGASLAPTGVCTSILAAPAPDADAYVQFVAAGLDAVAFVVSAPPGFAVVEQATRGERSVGVLRGDTLTFTELSGFAGDLAFTDRAIVVGSRDDRPWVQTDAGQDLLIGAGEGRFEWTLVVALPDGDVIVAGSGTGVVDNEDCVADSALHAAVARLAGDTLQLRWIRGLCVDATASVGVDLVVPEPDRGLVHVFGSTGGPLAFADANVSVAPQNGDRETGFLLALDLDSGVPQAGRPAPFGRFFSATILDDGRVAVGLVAAGRSEFDGVEVAGGAIVITRP